MYSDGDTLLDRNFDLDLLDGLGADEVRAGRAGSAYSRDRRYRQSV